MHLVRVKNISRRYGMSASTFYRWRHFGKYPQIFARIGGTLFVDEAELRKMAKEDKGKPIGSRGGTLLTGRANQKIKNESNS